MVTETAGQELLLTRTIIYFEYFISYSSSNPAEYYHTRFPVGMVRREIPGVTQVDEKGHEGNTAVITAYLCWGKHGRRNNRMGVSADHYLIEHYQVHCTRISVGRK